MSGQGFEKKVIGLVKNEIVKVFLKKFVILIIVPILSGS